jgi:hypothetical protein
VTNTVIDLVLAVWLVWICCNITPYAVWATVAYRVIPLLGAILLFIRHLGGVL